MTITLFLASVSLSALDFEGRLGFQHRYFVEEGAFGQMQHQASIFIEPAAYWDFSSKDLTCSFIPFYRYDSLDNKRTHADIREALCSYFKNNYELKIGIGKVFWGVTESQHLVDVVNQTDFVEAIDGEEKLGQPMVSLGAETINGSWEVLVMPYFRERTYAAKNGRLSLPSFSSYKINYESPSKEQHTDLAFRYMSIIGIIDLGISAFHGTNRDPFLQEVILENQRLQVLHYAQMTQLGIDFQATTGSWLLKLEAITRNSLENHTAATVGFEYSSVAKNRYDIGWLAEYLYDSRKGMSRPVGQNDVFVGIRMALNDFYSTEFILGGTIDLDKKLDSTMVYLEASGRFNNQLSWDLTMRIFNVESNADPLFQVSQDNFIEMGVDYHF
jgi:hypothetical protein